METYLFWLVPIASILALAFAGYFYKQMMRESEGSPEMYCTPKVRHKTFGVFFMKYSYEQRLIIVSRVKQGELIAHLSKEYHINKTQILAWVRMWDKYGPSGLEQQPHCRPTVKLKEEVVRLILEIILHS